MEKQLVFKENSARQLSLNEPPFSLCTTRLVMKWSEPLIPPPKPTHYLAVLYVANSNVR